VRRGLQICLTILGVIPLATGTLVVLGGPTALPGGQPTNPTIDSELRFLGVYWLAAGVYLYTLIPTIERSTGAVRALAAAVLASGLARALSLMLVGPPHPVMLAALALELAAPLPLAWWQARVADASPSGARPTTPSPPDPGTGDRHAQ
jgi:Domain of unknown function (DUF4345)